MTALRIEPASTRPIFRSGGEHSFQHPPPSQQRLHRGLNVVAPRSVERFIAAIQQRHAQPRIG